MKWVKKIRKKGGRKGDRTLYYWNRPGHPMKRLPDNPDSLEFIAEVTTLNAIADAGMATQGPQPGSFEHLVEQYRRSPEFINLAPATRKSYGYCLFNLGARFKGMPVAEITRSSVYALRDSMLATPHRANAIIRVLRLLLNFAIDREIIADNPAARPRQLRVQPRQEVWSLEAEAAFLAIATPTMALAYALAIYTAQRQADILAMRWDQYDGTIIRLRQQKTKELVEIRCHIKLRQTLDATDRHGDLILATKGGVPWSARYFNRAWKWTVTAAGLEGLQFRDLRRTAMVRMAEAGATAIEIAGVSGHAIDHTQRILETYIPRSAAMGAEAIRKLEENGETR